MAERRKPVSVVFMGTPDLAATVLQALLAWPGCKVTAVYTQPDRPAGRGYALKASSVKLLAEQEGLPVYQPLNFKNDADVAQLRSLAPDYLIVAAYGLILPQRVLDIPTCMPINVHTSLLPRHRGAAPIQRAIMVGDTETGVSIMRMEAGLDTGPVLLQRTVAIMPDTTAGTLHDTLAAMGGTAVIDAMEGLDAGVLVPMPQNDTHATYAAKLSKADGSVNFALSAALIDCLVRGVSPWPGAHAQLERAGEEELLSIGLGAGRLLPGAHAGEAPGSILGIQDGVLAVACGEDSIYGVSILRPQGRKFMDAAAFANGYLKGRSGVRFRAISL